MDKTAIRLGDEILYFYNSSNQNEDKEWRSGNVLKIQEHFVGIKICENGRPTRATFEDIRIKPSKIFQDLMDYPVHDIEHDGERDLIRQNDEPQDHGLVAKLQNYRNNVVDTLHRASPTGHELRTTRAMFAKTSSQIWHLWPLKCRTHGEIIAVEWERYPTLDLQTYWPLASDPFGTSFAPAWINENMKY